LSNLQETDGAQFLAAIEPGANPPLEQAPWLWYIPGAWKKRAHEVRSLMGSTWGKARKMVDDRRARGDVRESMIDLKLDDYEKAGWPMSQLAFNNLFGELLEAGADSKMSSVSCRNYLLTSGISNCKHDFDYYPCDNQIP
jgi:hypothetical protein